MRTTGASAARRARRTGVLRDGFNFNFPALRRRHSGSIRGSSHQVARRRSVRHEDHALRNFSFDAREHDFGVLGADPHGAARLNANGLHVVGMHRDGADRRLVVRRVLAGVDLLALLGGAASIHDEALSSQPDTALVLSRCEAEDHSMAA